MAKQSISGRVAQLARADIPALLTRCEDPELLIDQLVADYTMTIAEAESAVLQTGASLRLLEQDHAEDVAAAEVWADRAADTSARAAERREAGDTDAAERLNVLAERALDEQRWAEAQAAEARPALDALAGLSAGLESGLESLRSSLQLLTSGRDELVATAAEAAPPRTHAPRTIDVLDPDEPLAYFDSLVNDETP
jgi:phage shock protein A